VGLLAPATQFTEGLTPQSLIARYAPVFWEPLAGTGERIVAMVAIEPREGTSHAVSAATHVVLQPARLRAMLGRQRAGSAMGVLKEAADFMTVRQRAGLPLEELRPPFKGLELGPTFVVKGRSVEQLLDAAVRNLTAFGTAEDLIDDEEANIAPRHTVHTSAFLGRVRRLLTIDDDLFKDRFERKLKLPGDAPEVVVDYAFERWMVQVASLPSTARQAINAQREAQSKLFELEMVRKVMEGNKFEPVLLINEDALLNPSSDEAEDHAAGLRDRLVQLAKSFGTSLMHAPTAERGADLLRGLA
jgi:hypothetical protein